MIVSTLTRRTTISDGAEFEKRAAALAQRLLPYLAKQPGFVSRELRRVGDDGGMVETIAWRTEADCRAYLRGGAAAMAATWLDGALPTAPFPNGNWVRATEQREA